MLSNKLPQLSRCDIDTIDTIEIYYTDTALQNLFQVAASIWTSVVVIGNGPSFKSELLLFISNLFLRL